MPDYTVKADVDAMLRADNDAAIRSAIGVGQTDAPTFLAITAGTGLAKLEYTVANGLTLKRSSDGATIFSVNVENNALSVGTATFTRVVSSVGGTTLDLATSGIVEQRNGVNAQAFRVANSVGASPLVDYDRGTFGFPAGTNTLRIGTENGGTYTTARPIDFVTGGVVRMSISAGGALSVIAAISSNSSITAGGTLSVGGSSVVLKDAGSLVLQFLNSGQTAGVVLDAATDGVAKFRLRGNAAFATLQGKLTTDTAYTATVVAATGYITLYDSTGTAYRVPCAV